MLDIALHRARVEESVAFLRARLKRIPEAFIQLGTGLGGLADAMERECALAYEEIPHFPRSTVTSHAGNLVCGTLAGRSVALLQGRLHCYEGYSAREVAFAVRVLACLGVRTAVITNASGGLNLEYAAGSIMVFKDHINLLGDNPLRGPNVDEWGPRFPDLSIPYDSVLRKVALAAAEKLRMPHVREGVYVCIPGPSLETPAETRLLRSYGADAVGMSSIPEVLVALHGGMRVLGLSVVANCNDPDNMQPILLEEILSAAGAAEAGLRALIMEILGGMNDG